MVNKYSYFTKLGFLPDNPYKVNQDSFIIHPKISSLNYRHYFGVADGHGQYGKEISGMIKEKLPMYVESELASASDISYALNIAYSKMSMYILESNIDIKFSGSTCVTVLIDSQHVYCANVGDSRAVMCSQANEKIWVTPLSRDHKPDQMDEADRILKNGGRIDSFTDSDGEKVGPLRVWLKNEEIPGLAMTRAFGDSTGARAGVICIPEIKAIELKSEDKFIIIGSDGVWEFISNDEACDIVRPFYLKNSAVGAADELVKEARRRWKMEEEIIDDITCVIIFFNVS